MDPDPAIDRPGLFGADGAGEVGGESAFKVEAERGGPALGGVVRRCVGVEEKSALSRAGDKVVEQSVRETSDEADAGGASAVWGLPVVFEDWIIPAEGLRPNVSECDPFADTADR